MRDADRPVVRALSAREVVREKASSLAWCMP
jgi:hypothetical protein